MSNMKEIDGSKGICIGPDGKLLQDGVRPITPTKDKEGRRVFKVRSNTNPSRKEYRYVHVETFRHFSGIPELGTVQLAPEDVVFVEGDRPHIHNLRLSDQAQERIFGKKKKKPPKKEKDPPEPVEPKAKSETPEPESVPESAEPAQEESQPEKAPGEASEEPEEAPQTEPAAPSEEPAQVYHAIKGPGGYLDLVDPATGDSVIDKLNGGKKPREKQLEEIAGKHGVRFDVQ